MATEIQKIEFVKPDTNCDTPKTCSGARICQTAVVTELLKAKVLTSDGQFRLRHHLISSNCQHKQAKNRAAVARAVLPSVSSQSN